MLISRSAPTMTTPTSAIPTTAGEISSATKAVASASTKVTAPCRSCWNARPDLAAPVVTISITSLRRRLRMNVQVALRIASKASPRRRSTISCCMRVELIIDVRVTSA